MTLAPLEGVYDELVRQRRMTGMPQPGPRWMQDPDGLLRASCAADALLTIYMRVRKGSMALTKGMGMLHEMLHGLSIVDIAKGAAMMRRYSRKANHGGNADPLTRNGRRR